MYEINERYLFHFIVVVEWNLQLVTFYFASSTAAAGAGSILSLNSFPITSRSNKTTIRKKGIADISFQFSSTPPHFSSSTTPPLQFLFFYNQIVVYLTIFFYSLSHSHCKVLWHCNEKQPGWQNGVIFFHVFPLGMVYVVPNIYMYIW